ncbi:MAG: hypothetical protein WBN75_15300 [Verrucomicrobiia bacterium]
MVGTLAAAYAEAGRFDEAISTGQKACVLATALGETNLLMRNQELVNLYQAHKPYHEPPSNADASIQEFVPLYQTSQPNREPQSNPIFPRLTLQAEVIDLQ